MIPKDFTAQEQLVAQCLDELGLRYAQQVEIDRYTVDFLIEDNIILEADGYYGHSRKSDKKRDAILLEYGYCIIHIKSQAKAQIKLEIEGALCLESHK
jgi:very-short-patch-repair endonuclease